MTAAEAPSLLLRDVELDGARADVRVAGGSIVEVGTDLSARGDHVLPCEGGALLPGLHDHHLHLLSFAAHLSSVDCTGVTDLDDLGRRLAGAPPNARWVRAVGYNDVSLGPLDRHVLDDLVPHRPVRMQHRSGALWILNSAALALVRHVLDDSADVERDHLGEPTGRLWRYDDRLRRALPVHNPDLAAVGRELDRHGITGVTDATPDLDGTATALLGKAIASGDLPPVLALGVPDEGDLPAGLTRGPRKLLLRDHDLPAYDDLRAAVEDSHRANRPVAVHCVTRVSLLLTLAVLDDVGALPGDRVEHASVTPPEAAAALSRLNVAVVTQPGFVRARGEDYLRTVDGHDQPHLYPWASLARANVRVASSSDAPLGPLDPWFAIRSGSRRITASGRSLSPAEAATPTSLLRTYLSAGTDPGGQPRRIRVGAPADLCVLTQPLDAALREERIPVLATVRGGVVRFLNT